MNVRIIAAVGVVLLSACTSIEPPSPLPRSGTIAQGSARWAFAIAQPSIVGFAPDVQLYSIIGGFVYRDGRLPSNTGDWSFVTWSSSLRQLLQVTVKFDGTFFTTTRTENAPPSPNGQPLPQGWADSTDVFAAAAPHLSCGATHARLAVLNVATYTQAPGQPAWAMNFDAGQNQIVKWDGTYAGPQGAPGVPCARNLKSAFLKTDACANVVMSGTPYDMNDPAWLVNQSDQNRETCAYKFLSAFHILGYNTEAGYFSQRTDPQVRVLAQFQASRSLPVTALMTADALKLVDAALVPREARIAAIAATFPLYSRMQPLHRHDVSRDWLALIYQRPMTVLPPSLQMGAFETAQCIWGQCVGSLQDANGVNLPCLPGCAVTDLNTDYRFAGAYFDPRQANTKLPSGSRDVGVVLHEYGHYLDGFLTPIYPALPHRHMVATLGFYDISYQMNQAQSRCAPRRSNDPKDWVTNYGFVGDPSSCPQGLADGLEEWAEAFSMYVAAGTHFRAAAVQNATIALKYNWLKTNLFQGIEYDTDLQRGVESGCNDVPGRQQAQPGHASCNESYIWDGELRIQ